MEKKLVAVILVIDENDQYKVGIKSKFLQWSWSWFSKKPLKETKDCFCFRNKFINQAKDLLRYLRHGQSFTKDQIVFIRSSQYRNSFALIIKLIRVFFLHRNEDVLFYYAGHGNEDTWGSGYHSCRRVTIKFSDLKEIFRLLKGRLILILDTCQALAIEPQLRLLKNRYLLLGSARKNNLSCGSILCPVLYNWARRKIARPAVFRMEKRAVSRDVIDHLSYSYYSGSSLSFCNCFSSRRERANSFRYPLKKRPSLRRGSNLDYLMYPPK